MCELSLINRQITRWKRCDCVDLLAYINTFYMFFLNIIETCGHNRYKTCGTDGEVGPGLFGTEYWKWRLFSFPFTES